MKAVGAVVFTILLLAVIYLGTIVVAQNKKISAYEHYGNLELANDVLVHGKISKQ